jgi:transposase
VLQKGLLLVTPKEGKKDKDQSKKQKKMYDNPSNKEILLVRRKMTNQTSYTGGPPMKTEWEQLEMCWTVPPNIRGGGSNDYLIVGIDVGKHEHHACFGTATGEILAEPFVFGNHRVGFEQLIARADELEVELELRRAVFGLQPIAVYHKPLLEFLICHEETTVLVPTLAGPPGRRDNGWERHPAGMLAAVAERVAQGQWAAAPEPELEGLRQLVRTRGQLEQQAQGVAQRIRTHLVAPYFPELEGGDGAARRAPDRVVWKLLRTGFDPELIARMRWEEFWQQVAEPGWGPREAARLVAAWQAAPGSVGCTQSAAVGWEARRLADDGERLHRQLAELDELIGQLAQRRPGYASLLTIPGMGPRVAAMIVAELGEPHQWTHRQQVLRLAGLDLIRAPRSDPGADRGRPTISRRGNAALRTALVQTARVAVRCHPTIRAWFTKGLAGRAHERGVRRKREVKLAARLLVVGWRLIERGETFDPDQFVR